MAAGRQALAGSIRAPHQPFEINKQKRTTTTVTPVRFVKNKRPPPPSPPSFSIRAPPPPPSTAREKRRRRKEKLAVHMEIKSALYRSVRPARFKGEPPKLQVRKRLKRIGFRQKRVESDLIRLGSGTQWPSLDGPLSLRTDGPTPGRWP